MRDTRGRRICTLKDTNVLLLGAGPSTFVSLAIPPPAGLTRPRIKRRSAFMKHVKAKHNIDLSVVQFEEAAAAADLIRVSPDAERIATPPPDYTTATMEPMYKEEDLPTFSSDLMPKEEAHTPLSVVTPPPSVIDIVPSSEGYKWSSTDFVGTSPDLAVWSYC